MRTTRASQLLATSALVVWFGTAWQDARAQHVTVTSGTSVGLTSGTVMTLDSLNIESGARGVLESGSEVDVKAALVNGGTLTCNTGSTVNFVGGSQFLTGATDFANLAKSGGGTLTLNSPATVNGTLQLNSGTIQAGSNNLTIAVTGTISGASSASFIVTDATGSLKQTIGGTSVLFPVGPTAASYNPATIANAGTSDVFAVRVQTTFDNPPADINGVVQRQWTIAEGVAGGSNATLTLQWNGADEGSAFVRTDPIRMGPYAGAQWNPVPAVFADLGGNAFTATAGGFAAFSPFAVGNDVALAVQGEQEVPWEFTLNQNYPNPFNPSTAIEFAIPVAAVVRLTVYNILGQEVAVLMNEAKTPGRYTATWNAAGVSSGVYFYRLQAGPLEETRKFVLLK